MTARAGMHKDWGTVGGDTVSGAVGGAGLGAVLPGVGTAIGAGIGAAGGFLTGLLTGDSPDALPTPSAPPPPPDLADEIARRGQLAKQLRLMSGGPGSFLSGPLGDASAAPGTAPKVGGY